MSGVKSDSGAVLPAIALGSLALLLALAWIIPLQESRLLDPLAYSIAAFILSIDFIDMVVRLLQRRSVNTFGLSEDAGVSIQCPATMKHGAARIPLRPYALLLSVHNLEPVMDEFLAWASLHRHRIWIVDDCSTDNTPLRLRAAGFRCLRLTNNVKKPAALRTLLGELPAEVHTLIVLDPDSYVRSAHDGWSAVENCLREFQDSGAAALCPRIVVDGDTVIEAMQRIEYALSCCLGRRSLADFCTTAGLSIYRRDALEAALATHSLSVYAEDLENTLDLLGRGERIYYDGRLVVFTHGPRRLASWFSQRVGWHFGLLKVYVERRSDAWAVARRGPFAFYQYVIYLGVFSLLSLPLKIASSVMLLLSLASGLDAILGTDLIPSNAAADPLIFAVVYLKYLALVMFAIAVAAPRQECMALLRFAPLYLFYAVLKVVPEAIGCCNWMTLRLFGHRVFNDHYDSTAQLLLRRDATSSDEARG
jgi:cellulose synthase/poly-beta-1,6-N-acetylglucosamine synthase-like glycosyltransferase